MSKPEELPKGDLIAAIDKLKNVFEQRRAKEGVKPEAEKPKQPPKVEMEQLPLWNAAAPAAPNVILRSALFSAIQSKDRKFLNDEIVASFEDIEVKLKGEQLNQHDLNVFLTVENLAREHPDTLTCHTSERGLLKLLGLRSGQNNEKALYDSLVRLGGMVTVKKGRFSYTGGLIHHIYKDDETKRYVVQLNSQLGKLLRTGWTALDTGIRRQLAGKELASWLQASYATHEQPFPLKVETIREQSGSRTAALKHFRANLKKALDDLKATGEIRAWKIDPETDLVHVVKPKKIRTLKGQRKATRQPQKGVE